MKQAVAWVMRMPIFVPLVIMVAAVAIFSFDIVSIVENTRDPVAMHVQHSDDNATFVAAILTPMEPGQELRRPETGGWVAVRTVERPREALPEAGSDSDRIVILTDEPRLEAWPAAGSDSNRIILRPSLRGMATYLILPSWQVDDLARGENVTPLYAAGSLDGLRFKVGGIPAAPEPAQEPMYGRWADSLAVVWLLANTTDEYGNLSTNMLRQGGGGIPNLYAIDGSVVARDPWLRGTAAALAAAALVLAVLPRTRNAISRLPPGPAGAGVGMAAIGQRFLVSLRNAYAALATAVVMLGIPLIIGLILYAKNITGPAGHLEFIGTGDPWEGEVWLQLQFIFLAGVAAAARPAVDAHLALRRWRRREAQAPVEGELGD